MARMGARERENEGEGEGEGVTWGWMGKGGEGLRGGAREREDLREYWGDSKGHF